MQRKTRQRSAVIRVLEGAQGPLSIEELHRQAQDREPSLGLATVYRHLKNLIQDGEVSEVHLPDQATRVELAHKVHHHHFCCDSCHRVFDVEATCPVAALDGATLPQRFPCGQARTHALRPVLKLRAFAFRSATDGHAFPIAYLVRIPCERRETPVLDLGFGDLEPVEDGFLTPRY